MNTTKDRLTPEELQKLRQMDFSPKPGFVKASDMLSKEVGASGTPEREEFDAKARAWYYEEIFAGYRLFRFFS